MAEEKAKHGSTPVEEGVNVQVLLRCRPLSDKEMAERTPQVITCNEALREVTLFQSAGAKSMSRTFRFDKVFGCDSTQEKLFKQAITPIVNEVMDGFNCTIFAYGQTGTGKTYTMEGGPRESDDGRKLSAQAGVIPRSIKQIFDIIDGNNVDSTVKVSFLELYNEELTDLMAGGQDDDSKKLRAKNIRNRPELNQKISKTTMIKELAAEIERLKVDLVCNREKNGVYLAADRYELGELERVQLRESVKALKAEAEAEEAAKVAAMEALRVAHSAEVETLMASLERKDAEVQDLQDELNRANITIQC
ncbi:kinesin-like protein, partial [Haematococcus lacustris]